MTQEIKYELPDPAYEAYTWKLQDEHGNGPRPPISWGGGLFAPEAPSAGEVPLQTIVNGFAYARPEAAGRSPFGPPTPPSSVEDLTSWREVWTPQIEAMAEKMTAFEPAAVPPGEWKATLDDQDREVSRIFAGLHLNSVVNGHIAVGQFTEAYAARFGEEARPEALALLQGFPNLSLERAAALWDLSRIALGDAAVLAALKGGTALPETDAGRRFQDLLEETLERFGHTQNIGGMHLPTWREDPGIPLEIVKTYARLPDDRGPRATAALQEAERRKLEEKVAAAGDAELSAKLAMAQQYLPNLEDHNLIGDQRLGAAGRARWLAIGRHLVSRGLGTADDVFYYRRQELVETLEGGEVLPAATISERRRLLEAVARHPPPPFLGKPGVAGSTEGPPGEASPEGVIGGVAASRGVYRGRARIIETLDDAWKLEQGDVLVARMTSPPWTPLFATIGALVVNTGGALSHGAVVAREFGIPAVVGTTFATTRIPDGAMVTVDGNAGVVVVERELQRELT